MFFNTSKSFTIIFEPYQTSQRILCLFPSVTLMSSQLKVVDDFKYLWYLISSKSGDNDDSASNAAIISRMNRFLVKFNIEQYV